MTNNEKESNIPAAANKTINEWIAEAKMLPVPKTLFGEFWLEGEMAVMFADTDVGKRVLSMQFRDAVQIEDFKL